MTSPLSTLLPTRSVSSDPLQASIQQRRRSSSSKSHALTQKSFFGHPELEDVRCLMRVSGQTNSIGSMVGAFRRSSVYLLPESQMERMAREGCVMEEREVEFDQSEAPCVMMTRSRSDPGKGKEIIEIQIEERMLIGRDDPMFHFLVRGKSVYQLVTF
eukprot:CAMPEP_0174904778 /NCGR_PEP_ID=MMETSP0167-20121228/50043_1 /TAXON_ID=38298 /ORGANISM="Rhodella maculata, Strain CCMP736" /LENGTH=157 /DNA_ID=CAMNT_0016147515 /DNA_START=91 /DNA_END=564 /DNA_ORIENTATION=+